MTSVKRFPAKGVRDELVAVEAAPVALSVLDILETIVQASIAAA
jgi:hypothetical protein